MAFGINTDVFSAGGGELKKLSIQAFSDEKFSKKVGGGEFLTAITPVRYSSQYKTEQNKTQGDGTSTTPPKFSKKLPEELELEFVFDRTGVFKDFPSQDKGVEKDIELFKKVILDYSGKTHQPNYVEITWGTLSFRGVMSEMTIEYKLFKPDASVLRAVAKVKFTEFVEEELRAAKEGKTSPDLTHYRTVKAGDTLPLMTFDIYGDSKYYLEVAKANGIPNFRKLEIGQQIWFPPVQKQS